MWVWKCMLVCFCVPTCFETMASCLKDLQSCACAHWTLHTRTDSFLTKFCCISLRIFVYCIDSCDFWNFLYSWYLCKNTILKSGKYFYDFFCLLKNTLVTWRKCLLLRSHQVQTLCNGRMLLNVVALFWHLRPTALFHWKFLTVSGGWTMDMAFL